MNRNEPQERSDRAANQTATGAAPGNRAGSHPGSGDCTAGVSTQYTRRQHPIYSVQAAVTKPPCSGFLNARQRGRTHPKRSTPNFRPPS